MTSELTSWVIDRADAERVMEQHVGSISSRRRGTAPMHRRTIKRFLSDLAATNVPGIVPLTLDNLWLVRWMIKCVSGRSDRVGRRRLGIIGRYFRALMHAGAVKTDPISQFRSAHRNLGWNTLVPALQADDPAAALAALRSSPDSAGPLAVHLQAYLALQRALGKHYYQGRGILLDLDRFLRARNVLLAKVVTSALVEEWCDSLSGNCKTRLEKIRYANRFFIHLVSLGTVTVNPVPSTLLATRRREPRPRPPFIFTAQQLLSIFAEVQKPLSEVRAPWHARTCHTMVLLLYGLGLRHGEARRLRLRDIDLTRKTVFIDRTKFHKSRCLPFGPKVERHLQEFLAYRRTIFEPVHDDHPLFVAWRLAPVCRSLLGDVFRSIVRKLGIVASNGWLPRLHDLRHSCAVHRLLRWYREGVDVQARLPLLATFLGHVDIQSTEVYLTVTEDLLREANTRFYENFGTIFDKGQHS